jgi:hypothetical protein
LKLPAALKEYGRVETTRVEVSGVCRACGKRSKAKGHSSKSGKSRAQP